MKKTLILLVSLAVAAFSFSAFADVQTVSIMLSGLTDNLMQGMPYLGAIGMTTLAKNVARPLELGDLNDVGVIATDIIYEGAAVGDNGSGYARPLVAGDPFLGFAQAKADNSAGAAGAVNVTVKSKGRVQLAVGSLAITDVGKTVYASDDDTFTLTASTNSAVGRVVRFVSTGVGVVEFNAGRSGLGVITALTDSTTGTADGTVGDVGGSFSQATLNNNFKELTVKINELSALLK
jgi:hypothetical protein